MGGETAGNWRERAETLGRHFPLSDFHPAVLDWIENHSESGRPVGIAVSGGADSLCLLLLLWRHLPEWRERFHVLHFDHQLRGEESRADRDFVKKVAESLDLPVSIGEWKRKRGERVSEESARLARLDFFYERLRSIGDRSPAIFFGHQRDDIVENLLMRLSRGSGSGGLSGPRPVQFFSDGRIHLRPLLDLSAKTLETALGRLGVPYRVDATNARPGFYRNRLRNEVIPAWQEASPFEVGQGAALARELLDEDNGALQEWLRELLPETKPGSDLDFRPLLGKPRALHRRALHGWLRREKLAGHLARRAIEVLLDAVENREKKIISAGADLQLVLSRDGILQKTAVFRSEKPYFVDPWPLLVEGILFLPNGWHLQARKRQLDESLRKRILSGKVDPQKFAFLAFNDGRFSVRNWHWGDRYRPLGAPGVKKLQDLFVDRKIPATERLRLPVVLFDDEPVWVPGLPPADALRINRFTKVVVQLTYSDDEPV